MEPFEELKEQKEIDKLKQELNTNRIAYQTAMDTLVEMTEELTKTKQALDIAKSVLEYISSFYKSLILANPVSDINWDVVAKNFAERSDKALDQIKQITETKDVK